MKSQISCLSLESEINQCDFACIFQPVGTFGGVYLATSQYARDINLLIQNNIKGVISCQKDQKINFPQRIISDYLYLQIIDDINFNISDYFSVSFSFIDQCRRKTNVLLHCHQGQSCSPSILISYLIKKYQYTYNNAITYLKRKKKNCYPNSGFIHSLEYFAVKNGDFNFIKDSHLRKRIERVHNCYTSLSKSYSKQRKKTNQNIYQKKNVKNPQSRTPSLKQIKLSEQQIKDAQHQRKIALEIYQLKQQSKLYLSKRMQSLRQKSSGQLMSNYDRLKLSKKTHQVFYSPLKKYQKYQMFSTKILDAQFQRYLSQQI